MPIAKAQYIERARGVHGDQYSYDKLPSVFNVDRSKIIITCPEHGDFEQRSKDHLRGSGCKECGKAKRSKLYIGSNESFIATMEKIHPGKWDFSELNYVKSQVPVRVRCKLHDHWMDVAPNDLQQGNTDCPHCRADAKRERLIKSWQEKCANSWGEEYTYDWSTFKKAKTNYSVEAYCPHHNHGTFLIPNLSNHCRKKKPVGCPTCGYSRCHFPDQVLSPKQLAAPGIVYYLRFSGYGQTFYKVGFTQQKLKARVAAIIRGKSYTLEKAWIILEDSTAECIELEGNIKLEYYNTHGFRPYPAINSGVTECYDSDILSAESGSVTFDFKEVA